LTIVGDGPFGKHVNEWIDKYNLRKRVNWIGKIPWEKVREVYLESDVFIFTSLRDSFGAQLLEAMSFGLPLITLNINGAKIFIPENAGIKVEANTPKETVRQIANAITVFCNDNHQREICGKNGFEFAKSHEWQNKVNQVVELYKATIQSNT
jgi:glycosyltransferase involved in cell wall biosynthesis